MSEIQDLLTRGAQRLNTLAIIQLRENLPLLRAKMAEDKAGAQPHLKVQSEFLANFIEDALDNVYEPTDPTAILETAFALNYLLQDVDIIPDSLEKIGYADDSALMRAVLLRHRVEFERFAEKTGRKFSDVGVEA